MVFHRLSGLLQHIFVYIGDHRLHGALSKIFKNVLLKDHFIPISIIVPARNEEVTVTETVRSLLALEYPLYEIIVVDDGSVDGTAARLIETFGMQAIRRPVQRKVPCRPAEEIYEANAHGVLLTLIRKKNGGKADALNLGINACRYPYFICMDADSVLQYDSLSRIVKPVLEDENIVAVGGTVRPANNVTLEGGRVSRYRLPRNPLACMQVLEYARSFLASRILFDKFNGSLIISGAFGLFKKDAVVAVGGYDAATVGEDMELVVKLHDYCISNGLPYRMRYATDAICWSQVPEHLKDLCRQRRRWHLGLFQSMWKHRVMLGNPKFGAVSFISCFYYLFYELLSPFIEIFGIAAAVLAALAGLLDLPFMLLFFCASVCAGMGARDRLHRLQKEKAEMGQDRTKEDRPEIETRTAYETQMDCMAHGGGARRAERHSCRCGGEFHRGADRRRHGLHRGQPRRLPDRIL